MYCRMCGNLLGDTDRNCRECGEPTGFQEPEKFAETVEITEEIVFNPPIAERGGNSFLYAEDESESEDSENQEDGLKESISDNDIEAQKKEEENIKAKDDISGQTDLPEHSEFTWNVYDFPKPKKTEEIEFNWNLEDYSRPELREDKEAALEETLFQEIRDESDRNRESNIDRFFTFNKKNEAFQELLDKEYERLKRQQISVTADDTYQETSPGLKFVVEEKADAPALENEKETDAPALENESETVVASEDGAKTAVPVLEDGARTDAPVFENEGKAAASVFGDEAAAVPAFEVAETKAPDPGTAETPDQEAVHPVQAPKAEHLDEMARARALFFGDDLIKDNDAIKKQMESAEPETELKLKPVVGYHPEADEEPEAQAPEENKAIESADIKEYPKEDSPAAETAAAAASEKTAKTEEPTEAEGETTKTEMRKEAATAEDTAAETKEADTIQVETAEETTEAETTTKDTTEEASIAAGDVIEATTEEESAPVPIQVSSEPEDKKADEPEKKDRGLAGKMILIMIAVILAIEIAILGIRYFAPDSALAKSINKAQTQIINTVGGWMDGGDADPDSEKPVKTEDEDKLTPDDDTASSPEIVSEPDPKPAEDKAALISSQMGNNINIITVRSNEALAYQKGKDYGLSDINNSKPVENNIWQTPEGKDPVYYDQSIVGTIIAFDSQWIDYVNGGSKSVLDLLKKDSKAYQKAANFSKVGKVKETFQLLEIGEIRKGSNGYYVWTHEELQITEKGKPNDIKYNWIYYLEPVDGKMKIVNYLKF